MVNTKRICPSCSKEFKDNKFRGAPRKYCSEGCSKKGQKIKDNQAKKNKRTKAKLMKLAKAAAYDPVARDEMQKILQKLSDDYHETPTIGLGYSLTDSSIFDYNGTYASMPSHSDIIEDMKFNSTRVMWSERDLVKFIKKVIKKS